ncbi:MAG: hypothetical protein ABIB98_01830 [bacterium]
MKKIETIWYYLLWSSLEKGVYKHTQKGLAKETFQIPELNLNSHQFSKIRKTLIGLEV